MPFFGGGGGDYHIIVTNIKGGTDAAPSVVGSDNMALGNGALQNAINADKNISIGNGSLLTSVSPLDVVSVGYLSLNLTPTVETSIAIGSKSAESAGFVTSSVIIGHESLAESNLVSDTVAVGFRAFGSPLGFFDRAQTSIAIGAGAGYGYMSAFSGSVLLGTDAGANFGVIAGKCLNSVFIGDNCGSVAVRQRFQDCIGIGANTFTGDGSNSTQLGAIVIGANSGPSPTGTDISNSIGIGYNVPVTGPNQIIIGDASHTNVTIGGIVLSSANGSVFSSAIIGDAGTEETGINIGGVNYDALLKVSDISSSDIAQSIIHRHSTTWEPIQVFARSNSNGSGHGAVVNGMLISSQYSAGWTGTEYNLFGRASFQASATGTISDASSPGDFVIATTPDGATLPVEALRIKSDKSAVFAGGVQYASTTFAALPVASTVSGQVYFVSDVGKNGSLWRSNGTKWVLVNGEAIIAEGAVPICLSPTGSVAANGALTLGFALPTIYSGGIWMYFPAGAVFAGSAAGFYWTVMSSTTVGTIYNDIQDPAAVNLFDTLGSTTPIVAAGPGAYAGVSAQTVVGSIQILANIMGQDGAIEGEFTWTFTSSASSKTGTTYFGAGSTINNFSATTTTGINTKILTRNRGVTNRQINNGSLGVQTAATGALAYSSEDTTVNNNILIGPQKTAANDCMILESVIIKLINR